MPREIVSAGYSIPRITRRHSPVSSISAGIFQASNRRITCGGCIPNSTERSANGLRPALMKRCGWRRPRSPKNCPSSSSISRNDSPADDGKPKVFRDSAVENLREFFQRFRQLIVGSVAARTGRAARIATGYTPREPASSRRPHCLQDEVRQALDPLLMSGRSQAATHAAREPLEPWSLRRPVRTISGGDRPEGIRAPQIVEPHMSIRMQMAAGSPISRLSAVRLSFGKRSETLLPKPLGPRDWLTR